ncbi:hypothetical protein ACKZDW_05135 (plasmid) [Ralstonia syzygii subsp. celebesensis]|uniref:Uncharacterized protein n=3 Tax=Ralstonia syzygii TaxID=28097 RepID=A0A1U9VLV1_9RALS|nr:hypothetical protein [Ralstonia syzygii]AQW31682.1 hypothetical protein B0B51_17045 [blood disease bacterium A2-HR MARDI]QQV58269.1 hypothetical protein JK151_23395 [Ralstonia syzygii subsp. celebesensis]CCA83892.1 conserved hypothethical protein [blood disease bacterium R229]
MPTAETGHSTPLDDDEPLDGQALRIGSYRIWFAYDSYTEPDALAVYLELGMPGMVDMVRALNLLLGLCLEVEGTTRGQVVRHPQSGQLIYRFHYTLDGDHDVADLIEAISVLTVELEDGAEWEVH